MGKATIKLHQPALVPELVRPEQEDPPLVRSLVRELGRENFPGTGRIGRSWAATPELLERIRFSVKRSRTRLAAMIRVKRWDQLSQLEIITECGLIVTGKPRIQNAEEWSGMSLSALRRLFPELVQV